MSEALETIGNYLAREEPAQVLWHHLASRVEFDDRGRPKLDVLSEPAATIYRVVVFEGEVDRGGFRQFLESPHADDPAATLRALEAVAAHLSLELLGKVLGLFPDGAPADRERRLALLDRADPDAFAAFDEVYNQRVDVPGPDRVENVEILLLDYMKGHASEPILNRA